MRYTIGHFCVPQALLKNVKNNQWSSFDMQSKWKFFLVLPQTLLLRIHFLLISWQKYANSLQKSSMEKTN